MSGKRRVSRCGPPRADSGQATVEWTGVALLVAALFVVLGHLGSVVPVAGIVHGLSRSLLCAVSLAGDCGRRVSLETVYGPEVAELLRRHLPRVTFGEDLLGMPVDFRTCRSPACADPPSSSRITESTAGESPILFTRVIDCRAGDAPAEVRCDGIRRGNLYLQYWAYFPESASFRGVPILERKGYHLHDWEVTEMRIGSDGRVSQRASSHRGFNHTGSIGNWPSDAGIDLPPGLSRALGRPNPRGWGRWLGGWTVAGGSHAGNVSARSRPAEGGRALVRGRTDLVPLESIRRDSLARPARFDPITPPWLKDLWTDPEATGTG